MVPSTISEILLQVYGCLGDNGPTFVSFVNNLVYFSRFSGFIIIFRLYSYRFYGNARKLDSRKFRIMWISSRYFQQYIWSDMILFSHIIYCSKYMHKWLDYVWSWNVKWRWHWIFSGSFISLLFIVIFQS